MVLGYRHNLPVTYTYISTNFIEKYSVFKTISGKKILDSGRKIKLVTKFSTFNNLSNRSISAESLARISSEMIKKIDHTTTLACNMIPSPRRMYKSDTLRSVYYRGNR